ncbi:MAG: dihydroneopterin aldolase [candidate division WOR-3 bacterium]|jgi:dihydroneopterin aldolase
MYKVILYIKNFPVFLGVYEVEKKKKNLVDILLEYEEKEFIDYFEVYDTVETLLKNNKFSLIEEMIEYLEKGLKKFFKDKNSFRLVVKKNKPYRMKYCSYVEMEKCKKI